MLLLITPSNLEVMPYVRDHIDILEKNKIDFEIVIWDRLHLSKEGKNVFHQKKEGHKRTFIDYIKYRRFLRKRYDFSLYQGVIIYGLQLSFFLRNDLKRIENYAIDIRDFNKIIHYYNFKKLIEKSKFTSISSKGFFKWLPVVENKYIIDHNIGFNKLQNLNNKSVINIGNQDSKVKLGVIGSLRNPSENIPVIDMFGNDFRFELYFHGDGWALDTLKEYAKDKDYKNIYFTGRYSPEDENVLYQNIDWSVIPLRTDKINSKTLLPNRLYNGVINGAMILTTKNTYTGHVVEKYNLGISIEKFDDTEKDKILEYQKYTLGVKSFLDNVRSENIQFERKLVELNRRD